MYIEFKIEAHEFSHIHPRVQIELDLWSRKHNIPYREKTIKRNIRVTFDDDRHYTLFALTWNPGFRANYRVIRDLNNKV
jgi:hypothetical protein